MDYKKYSLENLENWLHDALSCGEASPHEIYSVIRKVVQDEYNYHKEQSQKCFGVLELLSGHRPVNLDDGMRPWGHSDLEYLACSKDDPSPECKGAWDDFWEKSTQYSEEELNAMCDKAASDQEKEKCREYNLREAEYYNKRAQLDIETAKIKAAGGYEWTPLPVNDKVVKWQLPVEIDASGEYFVTFPDDLLDASNLKEGDQVEWVDKGDGSYLLRKV